MAGDGYKRGVTGTSGGEKHVLPDSDGAVRTRISLLTFACRFEIIYEVYQNLGIPHMAYIGPLIWGGGPISNTQFI